MTQETHTPVWHWKRGIEKQGLVQKYRTLGKTTLYNSILEDDLTHHQIMYFILGAGDRDIGKLVTARILYILGFPMWLLGKILLRISKILQDVVRKGV
jgi:hypothetical protein